MGCGVSKVDDGGEVVVPAKLRPLLRRRFEDFKFRKINALKSKDSNLSKKQLLIDGADDDDSRKSVSSPENSISTPPPSPQPKGKLLNVTSCYNPACSGGHEKTRLLTEKAAAE